MRGPKKNDPPHERLRRERIASLRARRQKWATQRNTATCSIRAIDKKLLQLGYIPPAGRLPDAAREAAKVDDTHEVERFEITVVCHLKTLPESSG